MLSCVPGILAIISTSIDHGLRLLHFLAAVSKDENILAAWGRLCRVLSRAKPGTDPTAEQQGLVRAGGPDSLHVNRSRFVIFVFLLIGL